MAKFDIEEALAGAPDQGGRFNVDEALTSKPQPTRAQLARESGRKMPSPARGFLTAMQGPTFGLLDDFRGLIYGADKFFTTADWDQAKQAFTENRELIRGMEEKQRDEYPWLSTLTSLAASAPVMVAGPTIAAKTRPGMTAAQNLLARTGAAGATAGGYGALTAAGQSEADNPSNLLSDILSGGASSAAMAGMMVPAGAAIGAGVGAGVRMIPRGSGGAGGTVGKLTPTGVGPEDFASRKVAQQLVRDMPYSMANKSPSRTALAYQRYLGPDAMIVDVGGKQTRSTLNTLSALPGKTGEAATDAAEARMAGRGAAIMADADKALGTKGAAYRQTIAELEDAAKTASAPFYSQLRGVSVPVQGNLRAVLEKANKYLGGADEYAASIGVTGTGLKQALAGTPVIGASGQQLKTAVAPLARLDALKQYLYDVEQGFVREGSKNQAAAITSIRRQLINELDKLSPKDEAGRSIYKLARDSYAGPSQLQDAAEMGRRALDTDKKFEIVESIENMSASELQAMRVGLMQAIKEKAGTQSGQTWLMSNWKNPAIREKLQMAFGPDAPKFISALHKQQKLKLMEGATNVGSQTASIVSNADDLGIDVMKDVGSAAASSKTGDVGGLWSSINRLYKRAEMPESVRDEMGRILLMKGPEARQKLMEMGKMMELIQQRQNATSATIGRGSGQNPWLTKEGGQE